MQIPSLNFRRPIVLTYFCVTVSTLTTGCVLPFTGSLDKSDLLKASASDRYMVSRKPFSSDGGDNRIICTEPSPDVAVALSGLLKSSVDVPTGPKVETTITASQALVQLGKRYATVQMLRDMSYADCQAYANGMITSSQYAALRARSPHMAVTMLALEMLGGDSTVQSYATSSDSNSKPVPTTEAKSDGGQDTKPDGGQDAKPDGGQAPTDANGKSASSGTSGSSKSQKSPLSKEQTESINFVYSKYSEKAIATPFAIACLGILEKADARNESPKMCIESGKDAGCAVVDALDYCQRYMKWLTTIRVGDGGSNDGPIPYMRGEL